MSSIKDDGSRTKYDTGAVREGKSGRGKPSLLPVVSLNRVSKHFEIGGSQKGDRNWEKGIPMSSFVDGAYRHLGAIVEGKTDEDHESALAWAALCIIAFQEWKKEGRLTPEEIKTVFDLPCHSSVGGQCEFPSGRACKDEVPRYNILLGSVPVIPSNPRSPILTTTEEQIAGVHRVMEEGGGVKEARLYAEASAKARVADEEPPQWLLYISGQYSSSKGVHYQQENIQKARDLAVRLIQEGFSVICPHLNTLNMDGVVSYEEFIRADLTQVSRVDGVVMLPNWVASKGANIEVAYAHKHRIPVFEAALTKEQILTRLSLHWGGKPRYYRYVSIPPANARP